MTEPRVGQLATSVPCSYCGGTGRDGIQPCPAFGCGGTGVFTDIADIPAIAVEDVLAIIDAEAEMQWLNAVGDWITVRTFDPARRGTAGTRWIIDLDAIRAAIEKAVEQ